MNECKYLLVDHCLRSDGGHPIRMADIFLEANTDNLVIGCADCSFENIRIKKHFRNNYSAPRNRFKTRPDSGASFIKKVLFQLDCIKVLLRTNILYLSEIWNIKTSQDVIWFTPNTQIYNLPGILIFAALHRNQKICCYFQNPPSQSFRFCGLIFSLLKLKNVRFISEEKRMSENISCCLGQEVHTLLYPLLSDKFLMNQRNESKSFNYPVRLSILGLPRREKGFQWLPIVAEGLNNELRSGKLILEIQVGESEINEENLKNEYDLLKKYSGIEFIFGSLSPDEYLLRLNSSDAIFTPYLHAAYSIRLSWISIEGLALGKPNVVTSNTLAANILNKYNAGIFFQEDNPEEMIKSINELIVNFEMYKKLAQIAAEKFRFDNSADNFLRRLKQLF